MRLQPAGRHESRAMQTPELSWQLAATGASSGLHIVPSPWWRQALETLRAPVWPALIAALVGLALLLAFRQVVAEAVEQGDLRRTATAAQVENLWRCNLQRNLVDRERCLSQPVNAQTQKALAAMNVSRSDAPFNPMEK